jgi:RNA polymerase sigma factor (sigma-70 family)
VLDLPPSMKHHRAMVGSLDPRGTPAPLPDVAVYRPALIQYFRRKSHDLNEIEDLVQDVFLRIAARRSSEVIENFGGYVFQTAASVLADRHRRRTVRQFDMHVEFDNDRHSAADFDAARIVEGRQSLQLAVAALETLPERTRTIFILRRLEGHAYRDIAERIGISVSAVEKHMVRAVCALAPAAGEGR